MTVLLKACLNAPVIYKGCVTVPNMARLCDCNMEKLGDCNVQIKLRVFCDCAFKRCLCSYHVPKRA